VKLQLFQWISSSFSRKERLAKTRFLTHQTIQRYSVSNTVSKKWWISIDLSMKNGGFPFQKPNLTASFARTVSIPTSARASWDFWVRRRPFFCWWSSIFRRLKMPFLLGKPQFFVG
jgi:hypothetical protein